MAQRAETRLSAICSTTRGPTTFKLESGHTYRLTQAKTSAVLDLSMKDWSSVNSTAWDANENQKWVAERGVSENGWAFRNVATGLYLGIGGVPCPYASVVATREETVWDVRPALDPSALRILVAGTNLCVRADSGSGEDASVKLGNPRESGDAEQWRLEKGGVQYCGVIFDGDVD